MAEANGNVVGRLIKRTFDFFGNPGKSMSSVMDAIFGSSTGNPKSITENNVLTITPAWRAIYILMDIIATMPLYLYQKKKDGDIIIAENHALNKLVALSPHPLYTSYTWRAAMMVNTLIAGNGVTRIRRNGSGIPNALEIIPWDFVDNIYLLYHPDPHLEFHVRDQVTQKRYILHSDDVIHFMGLTVNGVGGMNTTLTHKDTFATEASMRDFVKTFLENGAFPSGALFFPTVLGDPAYKKIRDSWQSAHGGPNKAGKTAIVDAGGKYEKITPSIPDTGYETVKDKSISDISRIYGVPEYMLDSKNKPTYASVEQISLDFKKYTLDGWCCKIAQELTRKLISDNQQGEFFFDFDKTGLTSGDLQTMSEYYNKLFNMGWINRDEGRAFLKMNKVEGGERYWIQGNNMIPVDAVDKMLEMKASKKGAGTMQPDVQTLKEK